MLKSGIRARTAAAKRGGYAWRTVTVACFVHAELANPAAGRWPRARGDNERLDGNVIHRGRLGRGDPAAATKSRRTIDPTSGERTILGAPGRARRTREDWP